MSPFLEIRPTHDHATVQDPVDDFISDQQLLDRQRRLRWVVAVVLAAAIALFSAGVVLNAQRRSVVQVDNFQSAPAAALLMSEPPSLDRAESASDEEAFGVRSGRSRRGAQRPLAVNRRQHPR